MKFDNAIYGVELAPVTALQHIKIQSHNIIQLKAY